MLALRLLLLINGAFAFAPFQQFFQAETRDQWTQFNDTIKRVAVIGAGPAGLQAAAALVEHNFTVRLFDRAPGPGGNWYYSEEVAPREAYPDLPLDEQTPIPNHLPATKYYHEGEGGLSLAERWGEHWLPRPVWYSLTTNSPSVITELPDVPYPDDHSWVLSHFTIQRYVRAFATIHRLNVNDHLTSSGTPVAAYSTRVERVEKKGSGWTLTLRRLRRLEESNRIKATWWTEDFDAVVVATGSYDSPHVPNIDGLVNWSKVTRDGQFVVSHSRTYRRPEAYAGKNVLVLGIGTSGSEIAREIGPHVKKLYTSIRAHKSLHAFQRRSLGRFPNNTIWVPEVQHFEPLKNLQAGIAEGQIVLKNGSILTGIDEVILATGYRRANSFLGKELREHILGPATRNVAPQQPPDKPDIFGGSELKSLYWTGHYIPDPTLAFINVRPWTLGSYQSLALARIWQGRARIPTEEVMWERYNDKTGRWSAFRGLFGTIQSEAIHRQYVTWLNNEALEFGGRFVESWPIKYREVFSYYSNTLWENGYITSDNFTRFENTPADEWGLVDWAAQASNDALIFDDRSW